jgi:hypothetical protein
MIMNRATIHQDVIDEDDHKLLQVRTKEAVHLGHERSRGISKAKGHYQPFIMACVSSEGCLRDICGVYGNLPIARATVYLREDTGSGEHIEKHLGERQGVFVLNGDLVQCSVVDAHSQRTFFLLDKKDWSSKRGTAFPNESKLKEFFQLLLYLLNFNR